ncbi:MAG: hypothetical protein HIU57_08050 [Acidobacteria bacterium]|nr:hypothetical protein [Acidobacteriota bacterium]
MKLRSRTSIIALAGVSLVALATPVLANAMATPARTYLYNCSTLTQKPHQIVLTCADANLWVNQITWSHWSSATAHARGTLHWNTCTPTCVAGKEKSATITFSATHRRRVKGRWLYTVLQGQKNTLRTGTSSFSLPTAPL